jgi:hypothetical protein
MKTHLFQTRLLAVALLTLPAAVQAQFYYTTNADNTITIINYTGSGGAVTIPSTINGLSVTRIGDFAFYNNISLTSVTIPDSVTSIGNGTLGGCYNLTSVTVPNSVTNIGAGALAMCHSLTAITVAAQNAVYSSVNGVLFDKNQTLLIQFPGGKGGSYTIPNTVTSIKDYVFEGTALTSVAIGNNVTNIGDGTFYSCTNLTNVTVSASNTTYSSASGVLFDKNQTSLIQFPGGKGGSYTIPNSVTNVGDGVFASSGLTSVIIGNGISTIGYGVFADCPFTSITIPNCVTSIGDEAFSGCRLTNITIPDSVTSIGEFAFYDDTQLSTAYIGSGITNIGYGAFINTGHPSFGSGGGIYFFFKGNAPVFAGVALGYFGAKIYYLPGATGWDSLGYPILWNPQIQTNDAGFGVRNNQFGFNINWAGGNGQNVVVEACTNLFNPVWVPMGNVTFTNDSSYFSDPDWTNCPSRFYRLKNADPPPFVGIP